MDINVILFSASFLLYVLASFFYLAFAFTKNEKASKWATPTLISAAVFDGLAMVFRWFESGHAPLSNLFESMALYSLLIVVIYLILEKYLGQKIFGIFVTPIVIVTLLVASVLPKDIQPLMPVLQNNLIRFHVTIAILSYAAFTMAFSASLAYLMQERALKSKHQKTLIFRLPSLKKMEDISYFMVSVGLPLITIAMITGSVVAREEWGSYWNWEQKQVSATVTWIFFGAALYFRLLHDWRGRKFALVIIAGFISIIVTFFGVNLLAPGQHNFGGF